MSEFMAPEEARYRRFGVPCVVCGKQHRDGGIMLCALDVCDDCYPAIAAEADQSGTIREIGPLAWGVAFTIAKIRAGTDAGEGRE